MDSFEASAQMYDTDSSSSEDESLIGQCIRRKHVTDSCRKKTGKSQNSEVSATPQCKSELSHRNKTGESLNFSTPPNKSELPLIRDERGRDSKVKQKSEPRRQVRTGKDQEKEESSARRELFSTTPRKRVRPPRKSTSQVKRRKESSEFEASSSDDGGEEQAAPPRGRKGKKEMIFSIPDKEVVSEKTRNARGKGYILGAVKERYNSSITSDLYAQLN